MEWCLRTSGGRAISDHTHTRVLGEPPREHSRALYAWCCLSQATAPTHLRWIPDPWAALRRRSPRPCPAAGCLEGYVSSDMPASALVSPDS